MTRHNAVGMWLESAVDEAFLELTVTAYEFAASDGEDWLVVRGTASTASRETWSFEAPCLTTGDAHRLGRWLRAAAAGKLAALGRVEFDRADPDDLYVAGSAPGWLGFTEPNLAFRLDAVSADTLVLVVYFSHESLPNYQVGDTERLGAVFEVTMTVDRLAIYASAEHWLGTLQRFPKRGPESITAVRC